MPSKKIKTTLEPCRYYHIFNRGNNKEKIFRDEKDYQFFIEKYVQYMAQYVTTYAYCLMPDHFHFLIQVKDVQENHIRGKVSEFLRKFLQHYAIWFNARHGRTGSLFEKYFKRLIVDDDEHLKYLVWYIHFNPQKDGIIENFRKYRYNSFRDFINTQETFINKEEALSWYNDDLMEFIEFHSVLQEVWIIKHLIIED
jgi:REP element-mobilizing transposase RayT